MEFVGKIKGPKEVSLNTVKKRKTKKTENKIGG